jgi:peptide subunit release factor RF-3
LTEKSPLFGGAIQLAGEVKAHGERWRVRSDWMAAERERGISVPSAVMSFEHEGLALNLLDTPGCQDPDRGRQRGDGARRRGADLRSAFRICAPRSLV